MLHKDDGLDTGLLGHLLAAGLRIDGRKHRRKIGVVERVIEACDLGCLIALDHRGSRLRGVGNSGKETGLRRLRSRRRRGHGVGNAGHGRLRRGGIQPEAAPRERSRPERAQNPPCRKARHRWLDCRQRDRMPAVPDLPAERGPEQQAGPLNPEWRNDCPGRLSASWGHHRPHRRYGSGYPLVLLIVVRLNYMSALYFSSISFTAHKKHGVVRSHRPRAGLLSKSSSDMSEPPLRTSRGGGSSVLRKDLGGNPAPGLR